MLGSPRNVPADVLKGTFTCYFRCVLEASRTAVDRLTASKNLRKKEIEVIDANHATAYC
jgi:hypothetical protein